MTIHLHAVLRFQLLVSVASWWPSALLSLNISSRQSAATYEIVKYRWSRPCKAFVFTFTFNNGLIASIIQLTNYAIVFIILTDSAMGVNRRAKRIHSTCRKMAIATHCSLRTPNVAPVIFRFNYEAQCPVWCRSTYLFLTYNVFTAGTLRYGCNLDL